MWSRYNYKMMTLSLSFIEIHSFFLSANNKMQYIFTQRICDSLWIQKNVYIHSQTLWRYLMFRSVIKSTKKYIFNIYQTRNHLIWKFNDEMISIRSVFGFRDSMHLVHSMMNWFHSIHWMMTHSMDSIARHVGTDCIGTDCIHCVQCKALSLLTLNRMHRIILLLIGVNVIVLVHRVMMNWIPSRGNMRKSRWYR